MHLQDYIELQYSNITRLPVGITSNNVWSGFDMTSASLSEEYSSNFLQEEEGIHYADQNIILNWAILNQKYSIQKGCKVWLI